MKLFVFKNTDYGDESYAIIADDLEQAKALITEKLNTIFNGDNSDFADDMKLEVCEPYVMSRIEKINY